MTAQPDQDQFANAVAVNPPARSNRGRYPFDLHPALYVGTIACYFGFLAIMGIAFMNAELVLPFAIFLIYIAMAFGTPALWARLGERDTRPKPSWDAWLAQGIDTGSGWLGGSAAVAQVMTLPVLIVLWGVAVAIIRASV